MEFMKAPAIGIENFKTFIDGNYYLVDKTRFIADLVSLEPSDEKTDAPVRKSKPALNGVSLFLRPRRFGKTLTLSMLKYFFDIDEKENVYLFDGLAISREKSICAEFQNRFPVISLGLKTNDNLQAGVITGCLLDAKNQIFTGLNNPGVYTVTSAKYARYFGFTKEETASLLHYYGLDSRMDDVRDNMTATASEGTPYTIRSA